MRDEAWKNDFSAARNHAPAQSACDWNLVLDADEYLVSGKKKDLQCFIEKGFEIIENEKRLLSGIGEPLPLRIQGLPPMMWFA